MSHVFRYKLLAGLFGGLFLYMLWQGDAKYKYALTVPGLAVGFILLASKN